MEYREALRALLVMLGFKAPYQRWDQRYVTALRKQLEEAGIPASDNVSLSDQPEVIYDLTVRAKVDVPKELAPIKYKYSVTIYKRKVKLIIHDYSGMENRVVTKHFPDVEQAFHYFRKRAGGPYV